MEQGDRSSKMYLELIKDEEHVVDLCKEYIPVDIVANIFCKFRPVGKYEGQEDFAQEIRLHLIEEFAEELRIKCNSDNHCQYFADKLVEKFLIESGADHVW